MLVAGATLSTQAQEDIRLRSIPARPYAHGVGQHRKQGAFTNFVSLSTNISSVTLSVSDLPAGTAMISLSRSGDAGLMIFTNDQALSIVVDTAANLAQGEYTFYLMGTGGATNNYRLILPNPLHLSHQHGGQPD